MTSSRPTVNVIALLTGMAVLFNIERLDFIEENTINLGTFVYVIGSLSVVLIVAWRRLLRWPVFAKVFVCLIVYAMAKMVVGRHEPWWGGIHTYITVVEATLLTLLVVLAHRLALGLRDLERVYGRTRLADVRRKVNPEGAAAAQVLTAMSMARRHKLPLSVVAVEVIYEDNDDTTAADGGKTAVDKRPNLGPVIDTVLRTTDLLMEQPRRGHFVIVCQHTEQAGASQLARRICDLLVKQTGRSVLTGVASFPEDALNFEDLVHDAEARLRSGPPDGPCDPPPGPPSETPDHWHPDAETPSNVKAPVPLATAGSASMSRARICGDDDGDSDWLAQIKPEHRILRGHKYLLAKRCMDATMVLAASPLWLPLLALAALAVKIESPRDPTFFCQQRTGKGGRRFRMYKLRTMVSNAEDLKSAHAHLNAMQWPDFKIVDDPRVTRLGRILRKTSLDELPQMFNILKGEMSLVGPRPTSFAASTYTAWQTERLEVRPGITGLWQLLGRGETQWDDRARYDILYIQRRCLWLDMQILLRTIPAVLGRRGAH